MALSHYLNLIGVCHWGYSIALGFAEEFYGLSSGP